MDINSLINTRTLLTPISNTLNLKVGQQLDVKVVNAQIQAAKNEITLTLGGKNITVISNQPLSLNVGQDLKIQVTQTTPVIQFNIIPLAPDPKNQSQEVRLTLIPTLSTSKDGASVAISKEPIQTTSLPANQPLDAKITGIIGNKIQLQIAQPEKQAVTIEQNQLSNAPLNLKAGQNLRLEIIKTGNSHVFNVIPASPQALEAKITGLNSNSIQLQITNGNKPATLLTIDRAQISNAPADLKIGQTLHLDIIKTSPTLEFKMIPSANNISEAKIADYIKQFLPRHETPPILLNQLIKDLPQLMGNESVSKTLKQIAAQIIQNLPPKEQLITNQGLRQAINNSGLFLEAKLSNTMTQLPQLINNESVPLSLQRIAAEIVQNLSPKLPFANSVDLDTAFLIPKAVDKNDKEAALQLLKVPEPEQDDFKANLLKFIHALKQELSQQNPQPLQQADLDLLKNLQNKTENTVAKIVLDQLMSVPTDDSPKQIWTIDIPFMDRQQAETVKIEIQQDRENKQHNGNPDWSVNITVTPPKLDTIHCIVSYSNKVINTFFKSHNTQTTQLIKSNLDYLKQQLEDSGLTTGHMDAHADTKKTHLPPPQLLGKKLFDDKA